MKFSKQQTPPPPQDFDFVSIDIDGADYHIFDSLKAFAPKIVCIEYNFMIPHDVSYVQERDMSVKRGASAKAIVGLAETKGYALAAVTATNLIFIKTALAAHVLGDARPALHDLHDDSGVRVYIFPGYDGTILSNKKGVDLHWFRMPPFPIEKLQVLPHCIRAGGVGVTSWRRILFGLWRHRHFPAYGLRRSMDSKRLRRVIGWFGGRG